MIRFGVVLTVVLAAMGLLAGGVLANSLLLVYLAIGAAALAAIMLMVGVLIWREEVFGSPSAAQASPAAKRAAGPSPVLAATGVGQPGRSAGSAADHATMIGAAAQRSDRPKRPEHPDRARPSDRPDRHEQRDWVKSPGQPEQPDRPKRSDRPERLEPRKVADAAARQGPPGQESASRSPSGAWPEPPAEPVPGPRRGDEPTSGRVPPASREAAAADALRPRPAREPAAQSQGERDANVAPWSFFANPVKPSVAGPDLTQVVGAQAGGSQEADEPPKAARTSEAAAPAAGRPPVAGTAAGEDRAAAPSAAARSDTGPAAGRDRAAAVPAERDAPAAPAEPEPTTPEPVSAAAEHAAPGEAVAGLEAEDESPAGTAGRDGHAARGPDTEVTVVPGITRYHRGQCILIRFLGPEDLQTMTLQAAEMASYVPCRACRPEQVLAED